VDRKRKDGRNSNTFEKAVIRKQELMAIHWRHLDTSDPSIWGISGFRREADENCALLGYYAASSDNFIPTFRDKLSVPSSGVFFCVKPRKAQFSVHMGFMADYALLRQVFLQALLQFSPFSSIPPMLHTRPPIYHQCYITLTTDQSLYHTLRK